jgi:DMSO/TMAO reductase YedYZ molybdopterin-dependent catalytic subunit
MNGEPLPIEHGYPLRGLALGWTGANCVKWLKKIILTSRPYEGFFMDKVYRIFQKGQEPSTGRVVTEIPLKSIITYPLEGHSLDNGPVPVRGAAFAGEKEIDRVDVSMDGGGQWHPVRFTGPREPHAWRRWEYIWRVSSPGAYSIMTRAIDSEGNVQPESAEWNVLGYANNGIHEHAVHITIR